MTGTALPDGTIVLPDGSGWFLLHIFGPICYSNYICCRFKMMLSVHCGHLPLPLSAHSIAASQLFLRCSAKSGIISFNIECGLASDIAPWYSEMKCSSGAVP